MSQSKGPVSMLTPEEIVREMMELKNQLRSLQEQVTAKVTPITPYILYRVVPPEPFDGTRGKLQVFLT